MFNGPAAEAKAWAGHWGEQVDPALRGLAAAYQLANTQASGTPSTGLTAVVTVAVHSHRAAVASDPAKDRGPSRPHGVRTTSPASGSTRNATATTAAGPGPTGGSRRPG